MADLAVAIFLSLSADVANWQRASFTCNTSTESSSIEQQQMLFLGHHSSWFTSRDLSATACCAETFVLKRDCTFIGSGVGVNRGAADVTALTTFCIIAGYLLIRMFWPSKPLVASLNGTKDIRCTETDACRPECGWCFVSTHLCRHLRCLCCPAYPNRCARTIEAHGFCALLYNVHTFSVLSIEGNECPVYLSSEDDLRCKKLSFHRQQALAEKLSRSDGYA